MLSVKNVFAGYDNITVLNDITFDLSKNDILGVLGRNGMGKSTLIRVLSGLIKPSDGTIELIGENITNYPPHVRAQKRITTIKKQSSGFVFRQNRDTQKHNFNWV